ncbi:MAG TPA: penicillin-binding protein activator [Gammaproteobacteria bacterium]|nr:penicillin-binding protein activator [Gammaproteobacteria bacterium]
MIDTFANTVSGALRIAGRTRLPAVLLAFLAACTTITPTTRPTNVQGLEGRARAAEQNGNAAAAADLYSQLAAGVTGPLRINYLLAAARLFVDAGDTATARRRLTEARAGANPDQQKAITVLAARVELGDRRPQAALDLLATLQQPSTQVQSDAAAVRGQALFQLGRHVDAVRTLVDREIWLGDSASILANQRLIWDGFRRFPLTTPPAPTGDRIVDGWLALAPLASAGDADLRRSLLRWRETYTDHPAAGGLLAELLASQRTTGGFPKQIALLLPLTSNARSAALAIRDGFVAAHLGDTASRDTAIRVYDTALLGGQQAYLRAQLDGADFIVGPLLRPEVDQVIAQAGFVPTLALNYAQAEAPASRSFYQFALSSDDEARAAADSAADAGAKTAIAFVPNDPRGYRLKDTFRAEFEARGGALVNFASFEPGAQDAGAITRAITGLFNITKSTQRQRRLQANLGVPIEFEARRRQDIDAIFITVGADDARTARLLAPQLRGNGAGDIPIFATSDVFSSGTEARDNDLNGVFFSDAPSIVAPDARTASTLRDLQTYWPQRASQASQLRLYSMGVDAYRLAGSLYGGARSWPIAGMSGNLSLDDSGRIHRSLPLAQFRNGRPVPVDGTAPRAGGAAGLIGNR